MYGLEEKRQQVLDYLNSLSDEQASQKPDENTWSVLEVAEHLYLMEGFIIQKIDKTIRGGERVETTKKPIHHTPDRSHKVDAPEGLKPKGDFKTIQDALEGLKRSREATLFLLHNKEEDTLQNYSFPHPVFGEMSLEQWAEFIGWHEIRHLEQMKEAVEKNK
ncbi:hypothetical protein N780_07970 [Pontibacillus chungwhensis BH030062]|uniref:DinB-like domain-containing protein n=1 Tax=Pontibacillus chungwhensis BH030062 TaxID=1385513 RepID=A0A0A2US76_9BACI|nr:DinB family protein [Pontibacillus chungwhensis]KGP91167.1 hypothetical protein N780_07970 [Pontibacillus chungwhensis BH030062]